MLAMVPPWRICKRFFKAWSARCKSKHVDGGGAYGVIFLYVELEIDLALGGMGDTELSIIRNCLLRKGPLHPHVGQRV